MDSSQVLQSFAAFCPMILCSLCNWEAKHWYCQRDGVGHRKGMEGLQGCWMQEVELCSRSRSRVENWKHFTLGWRCVQCVWVGLLKLVKRGNPENKTLPMILTRLFFLYRIWSELKTVNLTRCFIIYVSHKLLFLVNAMEIYFKRNGGEEGEIFKAQNRGKIGIYI